MLKIIEFGLYLTFKLQNIQEIQEQVKHTVREQSDKIRIWNIL